LRKTFKAHGFPVLQGDTAGEWFGIISFSSRKTSENMGAKGYNNRYEDFRCIVPSLDKDGRSAPNVI
jgi:hypothetical protein